MKHNGLRKIKLCWGDKMEENKQEVLEYSVNIQLAENEDVDIEDAIFTDDFEKNVNYLLIQKS